MLLQLGIIAFSAYWKAFIQLSGRFFFFSFWSVLLFLLLFFFFFFLFFLLLLLLLLVLFLIFFFGGGGGRWRGYGVKADRNLVKITNSDSNVSYNKSQFKQLRKDMYSLTKIQSWTGFEPITSASQRSWVRISFKPEFFQAFYLQVLKLRNNCEDLSFIWCLFICGST